MKHSLIYSTIFTMLLILLAGCSVSQPLQRSQNMNISAQENNNLQKLVHTDPEFTAMYKTFRNEQINNINVLTNKQKYLTYIVALAVQQSLPQLQREVREALDQNVSALEIREALYIAAPFCGFAKIENALMAVNEVFEDAGIQLPLSSPTIAPIEQRFAQGKDIQQSLYGNAIQQKYAQLPEPYNRAIPHQLTSLLFGELYTRQGINIQTKELLVLVTLATLGAEKQLVSHTRGNLKVGNRKAILIGAMVHCLPVLGFPAMFNAINVIEATDLKN